jgi:tetratricopeptide (TPR) repeat protein
MGRQFSREQLRRLLHDDGIDVDRALAELERRGIVHRKTLFSDDAFRFGESLTQDVAYEGLLLKQRRDLHERIANLLEGLPGERSAERSALLAHHLARSANEERAIRALLQAAVDAERVPSYSAATRFYREAWDLAEGDLGGNGRSHIRQLALDAALGIARMVVLYNIHESDGELIVARGCDLAETLANTPMFVSLSTYRGMLMMTGAPAGFAEGLKVIEGARAVARANNLSVPSMSRALAWAYTLDGRLPMASELIDAALAEMELLPGFDMLSDIALGTRYLRDRISYYSGRFDDAARSSAATLEIALKASNRTVSGGCMGTLAQIHFYRGEYKEAIRLADSAVEYAKAVGNPLARRAELAVIAASRFELGEPLVPGRYQDLLDEELPVEGEMLMAAPLVVAGLLALGEPKKAARFSRRVLERAGGRLRVMLGSLARGEALRRLGTDRREEAERCYLDAIALADELDTDLTRAAANLGAAEIAMARGDRNAAVRHLDAALAAGQALNLGRFLPRMEELVGVLREQAEAPAAVGNC